MTHKKSFKSPLIILTFTLLYLNSYSQNIPNIKYLDKETIDQVEVDYDNDGDIDIIVAGVHVKKNQGRVFLVKNNGVEYEKPEYIFSYPSIGFKQEIKLIQDDNTTKVIMTGTSPTGKKDEFTATLYKGEFQGLLIPPISSEPKN
ncbi:MAG: hypothetical protein COA67_09510 [Lutibacter sp.]|nr:MAG: hypothetical protein COA67_09510 [Lutibacter sp.]